MTGDPVTPVQAAVNVSRDFGRDSASLLLTEGYGHGSISHPSKCKFKHIRDYLIDGLVPKNGTTCTADPGFLYPTNKTTSNNSKRAASDFERRLDERLEKVTEQRSLGFDPSWLRLRV
ncbi:hypothetical protein FRC07_008874 [Ceratobasidium sp. 392]|nr:hypothetical protein FRC07_008874 [Ceratobasidium sp. 392]